MSRSIIFLSVLVQACTTKLAANSTNLQISADEVVDKLVTKLADRIFETRPTQTKDMEETTLAKPNHVSLSRGPAVNLPPQGIPSMKQTALGPKSNIMFPVPRPYVSHGPASLKYSMAQSDPIRRPSYSQKREKVLSELGSALDLRHEPQEKPMPTPLENTVDDPSLANPLLRLTRMGTSWFGVIVEVDGVLMSNKESAQKKAWVETAEKLGKPRPLVFQLERAAHARNDVAVSEIFRWARERDDVKRISAMKDEIFRKIRQDTPDIAQPGVQTFLHMLKTSEVPVAAVSTHSRHDVEAALVDAGLRNYVTQIVADEDFYDRLDMFNYASQLIQRPPVRCVVIGTSNTQVEVAHHCGMKCVVVAPPSRPTYELASADLVSRDLSSLRFVNLRNLFGNEEGREPQPEMEPETEPETEKYDHYW